MINVPFLQDAFGTTGLSARGVGASSAAALTIVPVLETTKWLMRRGWLAELQPA